MENTAVGCECLSWYEKMNLNASAKWQYLNGALFCGPGPVASTNRFGGCVQGGSPRFVKLAVHLESKVGNAFCGKLSLRPDWIAAQSTEIMASGGHVAVRRIQDLWLSCIIGECELQRHELSIHKTFCTAAGMMPHRTRCSSDQK